ncbi:FAD-binding oxidoreductase [Isoptericola sp. S6320L]|uniref:FAD-binding oxidoreductase n=1 Tax=Isoptericola sp. S6320L TaxID=2926411 RepID=UPI001FF46852|nr:FAD-binding oxidoreductase [Isoptericola sp. S6320L]MCK0115667.1 FAD-binding oxidoreductase [Isoptericola sp. S6320L]
MTVEPALPVASPTRTVVGPAPAGAVSRLATALAMTLDGEVRTPGRAGYAETLPGFDLAVAQRPALVVQAATADDVARTVRGAAAHQLGVGVRATGHGAPATGPRDVLLDTSRLDRLEIDPQARTATVGAGVTWQAVLDAGAPHGLGGLCGSSPHVGVVGYTLGGGLGPLARTFGFAADHVRSLDVVTPAGEALTVTPTRHPELFWALRGGGGAFGVVTAMTFSLFPLRTVRAGALWFDVTDAAAVLHRWRELTTDLPDEVSTSVARLNLPPLPDLPAPLRGRAVLTVRYARHGAGPDTLVDELRTVAAPLLDTVGDLPYARLGEIHADPQDPLPVVERGRTLTTLPAAAVDALLDAVPAGSPVLMAEVRLLGGAVARPPAVPNAVGGRDAAYSLFVVALGGPDRPAEAERGVRQVDAALAPWSTGGSLLNFAGKREPASSARVRTAYGAQTYDRLLRLRRRSDPRGVLDPSARWSAAGRRSAG